MLLAVIALVATAPASIAHRPLTRLTSSPSVVTPSGKDSARSPAHSTVRPVARSSTVDATLAATGDVAILPPPATFEAARIVTAPPPAALRSSATPPPSGGVWAVVIGIDNYPGSRSDLRASVNDANDVDAALAAYGVPGDRRLVLRDTQATAATIADAMRWLVARAGPDATAVFFYAGHVRKLGRGSEAIVAADGRVITDVAMANLLAPLAARQTWIGMASCYAGGFTEVLRPGRILTGAADANSLAYENSSFGRSYLVEYMVRRAMLQRQAPGSIEASFAWAASTLRSEYPNRVPVQYDDVDGELRIGTPPPAATPAPEPAPPSASGGAGPVPAPEDDEPAPKPRPKECVVRLGTLVSCDD